MTKLENDLNNIFDDKNISNPRIDTFTGGVITRLTAANIDGVYDAVLDDLNNTHVPFHLNITNLNTDFLIGKGKTELRKDVIDEFKEFVSNYKGMIKAKYFKTHHDIYIGFYPYEMSDYDAINKTTAQALIDRYTTTVHTNTVDLPPAFVTEALAFKTRYSSSVSAQDLAKGKISTDRTGRDDGRSALNIALFGAYNFAKYKSNANYDFMHGIFPLETLETHPRHNIEHYDGKNEALATVNVTEAIYDDSYWVLLHNKGKTDLRIGLEHTADAPAGTIYGKLVKAGKNKSFRITNMGAVGNHFINITNLNLTEGGSWKADIYSKE